MSTLIVIPNIDESPQTHLQKNARAQGVAIAGLPGEVTLVPPGEG